MSRKKKDMPPTKERMILFRVTSDMYDAISSDAATAKMTVSDYCRHMALERKITLRPEIVFDSEELLKRLGELGHIGSNLNQIARHLNDGGELTDRLRDELYESMVSIKNIRDGIKEIAGEYRGNH